MLMARNLSQTQDKSATRSRLRYREIFVGYAVMRLRPQIAPFSLIYCNIEVQSIVIDLSKYSYLSPTEEPHVHISPVLNCTYENIRFKLFADYAR
jgi:hypothetical protein